MAAPPDAAIERIPFPHDIEEFNNDDRVSFSKVDNCWILEDDDGSQWEFNEALKKWMPMLDEELRKQQSAAYVVEGVDEQAPVQPPKKRKNESKQGDQSSKKSRKDAQEQPPPRKNSSVFVTNLPLDATYDEIVELFSKYGILAESLDTGAKRVKLYTDDEGKFKGEALVTYFREESVPLAVQMLDDSDFRLGKPDPRGRISVSKADFSYKAHQQNESAPAKQLSEREKFKAKSKFKKMNSKLADWDDDDPSVIENTTNKYDKVVIMKHMFTLDELKEDPTALIDIPQEIREECEKYGTVTNVTIYDKEPDGVVSVRFSTAEAAQACVRATNGRNFGGQVVEAYITDVKERFRKSGKGPMTEEEELQEEQRLERYGEWLENGGQDKA